MFDNEMFVVKSPDCLRLWRDAITFRLHAIHVFNFCPPASMVGRINRPGVALGQDFKCLVIVNFVT